jgi:predicted GTPase
MGYGAGFLAAKRFGAAELVDPRPYAVGSIGPVYKAYPHMGPILPAMGYGEDQMRDLKQTIDAVPCDMVLVASPVDLSRLLHFDKPSIRVRYEVEELGEPKLSTILNGFMAQLSAGASVRV